MTALVYTIIATTILAAAIAWAVSAALRIWSVDEEILRRVRYPLRRRAAVGGILATTIRAERVLHDSDVVDSPPAEYELGRDGSSGVPLAWFDELWMRRN